MQVDILYPYSSVVMLVYGREKYLHETIDNWQEFALLDNEFNLMKLRIIADVRHILNLSDASEGPSTGQLIDVYSRYQHPVIGMRVIFQEKIKDYRIIDRGQISKRHKNFFLETNKVVE